ncbi:penicillin-binding transpeptidase domain-containing protein [Streptomyces boncukensis]|uniref:penicillin-binding transpeptidase domain-containing protein n=1 Tax=Streptomyces boncukensis TaxID=2711219 RepID=UPI0030BA10FE
MSHPEPPEPPADAPRPLLTPRRSHRRRTAGIAAALLVLAGGGWGGYQLLASDDGPDPQVTAAQDHLKLFLRGWQQGDARKAASYTDSPQEAESLLKSVTTNLKPSSTRTTVGDGERKDDRNVRVRFTVRMRIPGVGGYGWDSEAGMRKRSDGWTVKFTTPTVHPKLRPGQTLALTTTGSRAKILDKDGGELEAASLVGSVDSASGKGTSGLQARYDKRLSGGKGPRKAVAVTDRTTGKAVKALSAVRRAKGRPVRTTIDPRVQRAAAEALSGVKKNAALVAVDPRNGRILAAANRPGGMNRALQGRYPPGSTFKVVTAAALLDTGLSPSDPAPCPKFARVNGQRFENQDQFTLPKGTVFKESFAESCNTFFVGARSRLGDSALRKTAQTFGIGGEWDVGAATYDGAVPDNTSDNDKAAATIGQGRVQASPLVMASLAATVKNGSFQQPVLVPDSVRKKHRAPRKPAGNVVRDLRGMMRAVVTSGSGHALKGLPGTPHAKTGTAEFGDDNPPNTHAWMIGYQGGDNLAWAVLLEDGGSGGSDAGPVAARFLKKLG